MSYIVLETTLIKEFFKFYFKKDYDSNLLSNLFCKFNPFLVTEKQLQECNIPEEVLPALIASSSAWELYKPIGPSHSEIDILAEMVYKSRYQIMLTIGLKFYPFKTIDITSKHFSEQLVYSWKYTKGNPRTEAVKHIKQLLRKAKKSITLMDLYLDEKDSENLCELFAETNEDIKINIHTGLQEIISRKGDSKRKSNEKKDKEKRTKLRNKLVSQPLFSSTIRKKNLEIKEYYDTRLHDRYLTIDDSLEILLSSGLSHLFSEKKDFTYIIRKLS